DNHYTRMVTRKWLAGAIARVYLPGVKFDIIPILEGVQGLGKSTLVRQLAPDYFSDDMKSMKDKDDYQKLMGSWIIELAELSAMNKTDIESIKNFTSAQSDYYRNTYARRPEQHPRRNVFIGSTNHRDYLKDATGERRFYPIKCGIQPVTKNPLKAKQADMLQILAEAKTWFDAGEKLYFDQQTLNEAKAYQQEAQVIDPMRDAVNDYLEMLVPTNWDKLSVSVKHTYYRDLVNSMRLSNEIESQLSKEREPLQQTSVREILSVVFNQQVDDYLAVRTNSNSKRVKLLLDNLEGWEYGRLRLNGKQVRGYHRIL
ncbi:virulence-associated E family protein, partial [Lactiplantibacillus plantarum]